MNKNLQNMWQKIVKETVESQILNGEKKGLVKNFLIQDVYYRESAFAANIFAVEYIRTKDKFFLDKAVLVLDKLQEVLKRDLLSGIDEPVWTPRGIKYTKGSIPATIILLYAIEKATILIDYKIKYDINTILKYLEQCYLDNGLFYHDKVEEKRKYAKITNTTAMAYFFLELANSKEIKTNFYDKKINKIKKAIMKAQREDGFFPYVYSSLIQKFIYKFHNFYPSILLKIYNRILSDNSIFFGDGLHHVVVLYYYIVGCNFRQSKLSDDEIKMLKRGFEFIKNNFKEKKDEIYFDFSWEPKPKYFRYCNFIDTSTYFYILDFLNYLKKFDLIKNDEYKKLTQGLINYIHNNLLQNQIPSIKPYQEGKDFIHFIMPRPAESIFDKGFFLSSLILNEL